MPHRWTALVSDPSDSIEFPRGDVVFKGVRYRVGNFTLADTNAYSLIKWDDDLGKWVGITGHTVLDGYAIVVAPDGESIIFGGDATSGNGTKAVWQYNGTTCTSLDMTSDFGCRCLLYWDDGAGNGEELYAGGSSAAPPNNFEGIGRRRGGAWQELGGTGLGVGAFVMDMVPFDDGMGDGEQLCAGGDPISTAGGVACSNVARWSLANNWQTIGDGIPPRSGQTGAVLALCAWDSGEGAELYGGGRNNDGLLFAFGHSGPGWRPAGEKLLGYDGVSGQFTEASARINRLAVHPSQQSLIVVGQFYLRPETVGQTPLLYAATYDATADTIDGHGDGYDDVVWGQAHYQGLCIDLGAFRYSGSLAVSGVAAYDETTDTVSACGAGLAGTGHGGLAINGVFYAFGSFLLAGGVPVQNIATTTDLVNWASPGHINGPVYGGCDDSGGGKGWFCGRFDRAFGLAGYLCLVGWNGTTADNLVTAIAPAATAVIRDVIDLADGNLIVTGRFESINGTACKNIAKINKSTGVVTALGGGLSGEGRALAHFEDSVAGWEVWVGHTGQTIDGSTSSPYIARWNLTTSTWTAELGTSQRKWEGPVNALHVYNSVLCIAAYGRETAGGATTYKMRKRTAGGAYSVAGGADGPLDDEVLCIASGDAGEGVRVRLGGRFRASGPGTDTINQPEALITQLTRRQRFEAVGGGLGNHPIHHAMGWSGGTAENVNVLKETGHRCSTIATHGQFGTASEAYAPGVAAMTTRGIRPVQGGVGGSMADWSGVNAFLRLADGSVEMGGDFLWACNRWIRRADQGDISRIVNSPNIVTLNSSGYFVPSGVGFTCLAVRSLTLFDGDPWMCGAYFRPHYKDSETGLWTDQPGGDVLGAGDDYTGLIAHDGSLFVCGENINFASGLETCVKGDGTTYSAVSPANMLRVEHSVIGDMGSGDTLYVCGKASGTANPVRRWTGSGWVDVGNNLMSWAFQLAFMDFPSGPVLAVIGELDVDGVGCRVAIIEPGDSGWTAIANMGLNIGGFNDKPIAIYGTHTWPIRLVLTGMFSGIADPLDGDAVLGGLNNLATWTLGDHWAVPPGGGVNAPGQGVGGGMG